MPKNKSSPRPLGASAIGAQIRAAFAPWILNIVNPALASELEQLLLRVYGSIRSNSNGERNIIDGNLQLLERFEFNQCKQVSTRMIPLSWHSDVNNNMLTVEMNAFKWQDVFLPESGGSTHIKVHPLIVALNPVRGEHQVFRPAALRPISMTEDIIPSQSVTATVTLPGPTVLITALYIEFTSFKNDMFYQVEKGSCNSLTITKVMLYKL